MDDVVDVGEISFVLPVIEDRNLLAGEDVLWMIVVAKPIKIGGHQAMVIQAVAFAVLAVVALAQLDAGNLGDGVGLVGWLLNASEQGFVANRLRSLARVNAARAQEQELLDPIAKSRINGIGLHHQVFVYELSWISVVGVDAPTFAAAR